MILLAPRGFFVRFELRGISLFVDGSGHDVLDSMDVKMFSRMWYGMYEMYGMYGMC